jgi:histidine ammonia-lyase
MWTYKKKKKKKKKKDGFCLLNGTQVFTMVVSVSWAIIHVSWAIIHEGPRR